MSRLTSWARSGLHALHRALTRETKTQWHRTLPFGEACSDRWQKAQDLGFGEGTSIYDTSYIYGNVQVGAHTWIGPFTILDGSGGLLTIGSYCSLAAGVHLYTHDSVAWATSLGTASLTQAPVTIGNGVYLGPYAVITKGVTIGDHAIIGAHSLIRHDVAAHATVHGVH